MLSIVIPVFNEADSLRELHREISDVATQQGYVLDILFIDDGSTDASWEVIEALCREDSRVRGVRFRRNFGKAAALSAGFAASRGQWVMTMDADLQDDPHEIPKFLAAMEQGHDVVSGFKQKRYDPWHKVWPSRVFNRMVSWMTGVTLHDHNCGFKCYRREVFEQLRLYGELHRFVPVLAAARGWRIGEVVVNHRSRQHGHSKYGILRIPKGFLDLLTVKFLTGYGQRPQHILGTVGLASFSCGMFGIMLLTVGWLLSRLIPGWDDIHLTQRAIFFYCLGATLLGGQFMSIGFLAELLTAFHGRSADTYSVSERVGGEASWRLTDERFAPRHPGQPNPAFRKDAAPSSPHLKLSRSIESSRERI
ncbi:MAG: glycosyltransferase family 2 protein [Planctomycetales bacterium]|nr:glycosyltransferase family 2 protein [Planctomycetales bacterium]